METPVIDGGSLGVLSHSIEVAAGALLHDWCARVVALAPGSYPAFRLLGCQTMRRVSRRFVALLFTLLPACVQRIDTIHCSAVCRLLCVWIALALGLDLS